MKFRHVGRHLVEYWDSLRGAERHGGGPTLGEVMRCPVFVINLERSIHRREYMIKHLAGHGVAARMFPAVDGSVLDVTELERNRVYVDALALRKFSRSLSRAEIACTLSHVNIYRTIVEEDIPIAMVLEDDALLVPAISEKIRAGLAEAPKDWDVLQLFHICDEHVAISPNLVRFPSKSRMPVGSAGYLIRRSGAEKMLANSLPVCYPADSLLGRSYRWGIVMYGFVPPLLVQNSVFPTQIYAESSLAGRITRSVKSALSSVTGHLAKALNRSR